MSRGDLWTAERMKIDEEGRGLGDSLQDTMLSVHEGLEHDTALPFSPLVW